MASLAPDVLDFDNQPWVEQIVIYIGITVTRLTIYFIHRLGKPAARSFDLLYGPASICARSCDHH